MQLPPVLSPSILSIVLLSGLATAILPTAKQPWSNYTVHDKTRPLPPKVKVDKPITTPAPSDAIVLFNGKGTSEWTQPWRVKDGVMIASPKDNLTKREFADCQLHLEWRVPAGRKVKGQSGGNSGIFLMNLYEVQILESHDNLTYADGQAGALYGQTPPSVNASLPQGSWQSYDIFFKAPRYDGKKLISPAYITVIHNGVVIHNHQQFYGPTKWRRVFKYPETHPEKAPIRLQWHRDPIEYRNIWVRPLK